MKKHIQDTLKLLSEEKSIDILYACESGSRAWGFASPDSDWDVRFIYTYPLEWYLELDNKKDTIDLMLPLELDLGGWELQKALRLFASCNLALYEWINSPETYYVEEIFHSKIQSLMPEYFSSIKGMHHYLAMAKKNFDSHLNGNQIKIKKLFYILRPLLACEWIAEKQAMPPTEYGILLEQSIRLSGNQLKEVQAFMKLKESAEEGFLISLTEDLIDWFKKEIIFYQKVAAEMPKANEVSMEPLNELFRMALKL